MPGGRVASIQLCVGHRVPMATPREAVARVDFGLEGDRHARTGSLRQVLIADAAVLAEEGLPPGGIRENLTVEGLGVDGLPPGTRLRCGESVLRVVQACEPCGQMDEIRPGLREALRGRRGVLTVVETGGRIRVGDAMVPLA